MQTATLDTVQVDELTIGYRDLGEGPPVLLLHGWPTSSHLWRDLMPPIARANRVIAPDLPGFGASSKPAGVRYDFPLFERAVDGLLEQLGVAEVGLAVHDLGGPIGLHWTVSNPQRVTRLALLNTLVYPQFAPSVVEFVTTLATPGKRDHATSREGLAELAAEVMPPGFDGLDDLVDAFSAPFDTPEARRALADAGIGLDFEGFTEIERKLPQLTMPVRIVYGEEDRALPDVAETMARVARDLPRAVVTPLPGRGHFIQEEAPEQVGELLAEFFAARSPAA
jgi:pimeloyl-ACP methyl ester carboxylesterase